MTIAELKSESAETRVAPRLRVGLVSGIVEQRYGGPATVLRMHSEALSVRHDVSVFGVAKQFEACLGAETYIYGPSFPERWYRGRGLRRDLMERAKALDVFHAHMLWDHTVFAASSAAASNRLPLFITPHGSLMDHRSNAFHKKLYGSTILKQVLKRATGLHVLNQAEADACRRHGITKPLFIIPNGLPAESFDLSYGADQVYTRWPLLRARKVLLYVGRVAQIKGLDMLINAFAELRPKLRDWMLVIAGPDEHGVRSELEQRVRDLGISSGVFFAGAVYGDVKHALLSVADACALPSRSEGFSVALIESAAKAKPILYTTACHFPELAKCGGGIEVEPTTRAIARGLLDLLSAPERVFQSMGRVGRELVLRSYTMEKVAAQLEAMYLSAGK